MATIHHNIPDVQAAAQALADALPAETTRLLLAALQVGIDGLADADTADMFGATSEQVDELEQVVYTLSGVLSAR